MNILVTGGLGFIGHNVVQILKRLHHNVIVVDNQTTYGIVPKSELDFLIGERAFRITPCTTHTADIKDQGTMEYIMQRHNIELVIHLASFPRQKVVNANPCLGSQTMSEGLLNLLEAAKKYNVGKFVYVSSSMVYGNFDNNVVETVACNPQGQYGIMKLAGEWLVKDYARRTDMSYIIVRPSAVYGPLDVEDRVISKFILTAMRDGVIKVNGANETLDFTYVDDAADGIVAATLTKHQNQTYNITRSRSRTLLEAAELAINIVGQGRIDVQDKDADFPSRGALNTQAAQQDLGFAPKIDIEQGFQRYYEWLKDSPYFNR